jgi:hypothetical protein
MQCSVGSSSLGAVPCGQINKMTKLIDGIGAISPVKQLQRETDFPSPLTTKIRMR